MAKSIVERVLGTTNPYTTTYLDEILRLTKSFTIVNETEAELYNELVVNKYGLIVNEYDKSTWRYYSHLVGEYHQVDQPMVIVSRDNRKEITLSLEMLELHIETKEALCKYGSFFDEVVFKYPEQELLLRTMLSSNELPSKEEIMSMPDWTIVGWNANLIERQETNLILSLQERIYNFSIKSLISHYRISDNLFMACLFFTLYHFIYNTLMSLRLDNARTGKVHSYYRLLYFASHHNLDLQDEFLDDHQRLFLYRNLLYLDTHAGSNETLQTLVDEFFTRKRIVATNYIYNQLNEVEDDMRMDYGYSQELLNKTNYVYDKERIDLIGLAEKEIGILENNEKEYEFNMDEIDFQMKKSLNAIVKTKDLEITLNDTTNDVRYKLIDLVMDYWPTTIELGYNTALCDFIDPVSGEEFVLTAEDNYKLFLIILHLVNDVELIEIPDMHIARIIREELLPETFTYKRLQRPFFDIKKKIDKIHQATPSYRPIETRRTFRNFLTKVYKFELASWIEISSTGDLYASTDISRGFEDVHRPIVCKFGNEKVKDFLNRIQFTTLNDYTHDQLSHLLSVILDRTTDNVLELTDINRLTQIAMLEIVNKFKSYSTQTLSRYNNDDVRLLDYGSPKYSIHSSSYQTSIFIDIGNELNMATINVQDSFRIDLVEKIKSTISTESLHLIDLTPDITILSKKILKNRLVDPGVVIVINEEESSPKQVITLEMIKNFIK